MCKESKGEGMGNSKGDESKAPCQPDAHVGGLQALAHDAVQHHQVWHQALTHL